MWIMYAREFIHGKVVNFKSSLLPIDKEGIGGTKVSIMQPYTALHGNHLQTLCQTIRQTGFRQKNKEWHQWAPFGACFDTATIGMTATGPAVPDIDLVLQNDGVNWRIYGANSMVRAGKNVVCLGFVDGGKYPITSVVIGGHQLEDNLLKFDLVFSKLRFSSSSASQLKADPT